MTKHWIRTCFLVLLLLAINAAFVIAPRASYRAIVIHHSASDVGDLHSIRRSHLARGWFEIGYHFVLSNGSTAVPAGHLYPTRRYKFGTWSVATSNPRFNLTALHLCVVGNFEKAPMPAQLQTATGHALRQLQERHGIGDDQIFLHRDCNATVCPGKHVDRASLIAWADRASSLSTDVQAQHRQALDRFRLSATWFNGLWLLVNLPLFSMFYRSSRRSTGPADQSSP